MKRGLLYLFAGTIFGLALMKGQAASWYQIQAMFHFKSFQIFGFFMTAVPTAALSVYLLKRFKVKNLDGELIETPTKPFNKGTVVGSALFGIGWGLTGTCPGPIFVQIGSGAAIAVVTLISALAGTWVYSYFRDRLPH